MRMALAIIICKIANTLSKLLKKEGTVIGGYWALKIYPNVLNNIKYPKYVIGVTGSSGKGSTTELIAHILNKNNITYAYNKNGSNAINGITSLILSNTSLNGKYKKQALLMELDEKHMVHLLEHFTLTHLVITNITRDQPPRNAHPEYIQSLIKSILKDNMHLVVNVDDPLVYALTLDHKGKKTYYGMDKNNYSKETHLHNIDAQYCPICGSKLIYEYYHYGHLGKYKCTNCDFKRPNPDFLAHTIDIEHQTIYINRDEIKIPSNFLYSVYFTTAAYSLANTLGLKKEKILHAINIEPFIPKRLNIYNFYGRTWQMISSKNENNLSYKQSIDYIIHEKRTKTIVLGFDNSSRRYKENDVSWLWDIDFESLKDKNIDKIVVIGRFKYDIMTRLEYAKIEKEKLILIENLETEIIDTLKNKTKGNIYSMVCFDKESELKEILKKEGITHD